MKTKVAVFGFNNLAQSVVHTVIKRRDLDLVGIIADETPVEIADSLNNDSIYAQAAHKFSTVKNELFVDDEPVVIGLADDWGIKSVDVVIDCVAESATMSAAKAYFAQGAAKVVFAAAADDVNEIILGVNEHELKTSGDAISAGGAAMCAVRPVRDIVADVCGVEQMLVTTVNGVLGCGSGGGCDCGDTCKCDGDCCMQNVESVPAPTLVASMSELVCLASRNVTVEKLNEAIVKAVKEPYYQGIIAATDLLLKPDAVIGESVSGIVELPRTVVQGHLVSIKLWYDRDWGYANRLVELAADLGKTSKVTQ